MTISKLAEQLAATLHSAKIKTHTLQDIEAFAETLSKRGFPVTLGEGPRPGQACLICDLDGLALPDLPAAIEEDSAPEADAGKVEQTAGRHIDAGPACDADKYEAAKAGGHTETRQTAPEDPAPARPKRLIGNHRWTKEDDARMLDMKARRLPYSEIAAELGRSEKAVSVRLVKLSKAAKAAVPAPEQKPNPRPKPAPEPAPAPSLTPEEFGATALASETAPAAEALADPGAVVAETISAVQAPEPDAPEVELATISPAPAEAKEDRGPWALHLPTLKGDEQRAEFRLRSIGYSGSLFSPESDLALVTGLVRGDGMSAAAEAAKLTQIDARARWNALLPEVTVDGQTALLSVLKKRAEKWSAAQQ